MIILSVILRPILTTYSPFSELLTFLQSLPAAHIKGRGSDVWKVENGKITPQWDCESSGVGSAFVAGGMWFSHEENSLNVPVCGWYYVTSQITFRGNREQAQQFAHTLNVERNCNSTSRLTATYTRTSYTTIPPLDDGTRGKSSTILSDVVKICEGGKIFVSIPSYSCCPLASESSTSIAAYLVSESDCYWPLLTSKPEQFQRSQR